MPYNQTNILDKINLYLKIIKSPLFLERGYCHGLTLLWLYKMSKNTEKWFYDMVKLIVDTPKEKFGDIEIEIEKFISHIEWLQKPEKYVPSIRQMDIDQTIEVPKELPLSSIFIPSQLDSVLELVIQPNKMVCISGPDHSIGIMRRGNTYHIYNPNYATGVAKILDSTKALRYELIQCLFADFEHPTKKLAVTINVLGEGEMGLEKKNIHQWIIKSTGAMNFCDYGIGPLYLACENHDVELVKLLLEKKADVNRPTKNNRYPLLLCSYSGYEDIAKLLIQYHADPNVEGREGLPLYAASKNGHRNVISLLLQNEAAINKTDSDGETAIFGSVRHGHPEITKLLLENGANPLLASKNGDTSMDLAIAMKDWGAVGMMLLYVDGPHSRNLQLIKRNKKKIEQAVEALAEKKELAGYEQVRIFKLLDDIATKKRVPIKTIKAPEVGRREIESDRARLFFHEELSEEEGSAKEILRTTHSG